MKKSVLFLLCACMTATGAKSEFLLILHPAYDSKGGRVIHGDFERDMARQWGEALRSALIEELPTLKVVNTDQLMRQADPIAMINQINRMGAHLLLSLNLFEAQTYPQLYLYHMLYAHSHLLEKKSKMGFIPYRQAYTIELSKTLIFESALIASLQNNKKSYDYKGSFGVPYKPLIGLLCPAIGLEFGVTEPKSWELTIPSLVQAIISAILPFCQGE